MSYNTPFTISYKLSITLQYIGVKLQYIGIILQYNI